MRSLLYLLLVFLLFLEQGSSAPIPSSSPGPAAPKAGDFVGVRPAAYEEKSKDNKKVSIHPGVVVAGPLTDGTYHVAMISKSLPDNPPQASIHDFHTDSSIHGSVSLAPPKNVHVNLMKPWKDGKTGNVVSSMNEANLEKMKNMMKPHGNWKPSATQAASTSIKKK